MADKTTGHTPKEIVRDALGVNFEQAAGATKDASQWPKSQGHKDVDSGPPTPTQQEVAAQAQLDQGARLDPRPDREGRLVELGRSEHTKGRLGGNK